MKKGPLLSRLKEFGLNTKQAYVAEAFSRNIGLLRQAEQEQLANATVAIDGGHSVLSQDSQKKGDCSPLF